MKANENIFDKAVNWYIKGNDFRKAALELFDEETLKKEVERTKKEQFNNLVKNRENELKEKLDGCLKLFPVGTLIDSDDGTDKCLNIIVGKPYIGEADYHWPNYLDIPIWELKNHRTILAKTVRISFNEVIDKSMVCLENILYFMDSDSKYSPNRGIVNLKDYVNQKNEMRLEEIDKINKKINEVNKELKVLNAEFSLYDSYNPSEFTQEKVDEIVKQYKQ